MNYRALAIDLDGTLLVGEDIPPANTEALRSARDAGIKVIIATARWKEMAFRVADQIGVEDPVIACSGAQVHDRQSNTDWFDERLPEDFTAALYDICNATRCIATITVSDRVLLKLDGEPDRSQMAPEMNWVPALELERDGLPRIAAVQGGSAIARVRDELEASFADRVNIFDSIGPTGKLILTITSKGATKGTAVEQACKGLGIAPAQVVAFGDAENDVAMFRVAGAAVAMGQADAATKAAATTVTAPHDEAGVAQAVYRLLETGSPNHPGNE